MDWHGDTTDMVGGNVLLGTRLIQTENIATPEAREELVDAILKTETGQFLLVASKGVQDGDPNGETSVTPAWRKAVLHYGYSRVPEGQDGEIWKENARDLSDSLT